MSKIFIVGSDLTEMEVDAVVNATSESLWTDTELSERIFTKAGHWELTEALDKIGFCVKGGAVITSGFGLKAKKIIHAVGPVWKGGSAKEAMYLDRVYRNALQLAMKNEVHTIAFSLISSEKFEYPVDECWHVALDAVTGFLRNHEDYYMEVTFCVERKLVRQMGQGILMDMEARNGNGSDAPVTYLFTITVHADDPIVVGQDEKNGRRQIIPFLGGTLKGHNLQGKPIEGTLLPGGADIQLIRQDGTCELSARYGVMLSDGRSFFVENNGIRTVPKEYAAKVLKGEMIASDLYYFATTPKIEVYDESLRWLERHVFFCKAIREVNEVKISYYIIGK